MVASVNEVQSCLERGADVGGNGTINFMTFQVGKVVKREWKSGGGATLGSAVSVHRNKADARVRRGGWHVINHAVARSPEEAICVREDKREARMRCI